MATSFAVEAQGMVWIRGGGLFLPQRQNPDLFPPRGARAEPLSPEGEQGKHKVNKMSMKQRL
jgi:hypothetical protein